VTVFDDWLSDVAARIDSLPNRSTSALFLACAGALLPEFRHWAAHTGQEDLEPLAERALAVARTYALTGNPPPEAKALLASLQEATPSGESPDEVSATGAQDFWICVDLSVRVIVDPRYEAGTGLEYALEPIVQNTTERLFGVSQVGSGPDEDAQMQAVMNSPEVSSALDFCTWAIDFLASRPTLTEDDLAELTNRAAAIAPPS
jgi:hypothetical protein